MIFDKELNKKAMIFKKTHYFTKHFYLIKVYYNVNFISKSNKLSIQTNWFLEHYKQMAWRSFQEKETLIIEPIILVYSTNLFVAKIVLKMPCLMQLELIEAKLLTQMPNFVDQLQCHCLIQRQPITLKLLLFHLMCKSLENFGKLILFTF